MNNLTSEFTTRIDNTINIKCLEDEIESLYHILYRNRDDSKIRFEMIEKIQYITKRLRDINTP